MINITDEINNYSAIDISKILENNTMPDNIVNSIILYNKAIDCLKLNSEDISIIELKKAISLNPDFCEAMNLLGLIYYSIDEISKAHETFNKVLLIENDNIKTLEYLKNITASEKNMKNTNPQKKIIIKNIEKSDAYKTISLIKLVKVFSKHRKKYLLIVFILIILVAFYSIASKLINDNDIRQSISDNNTSIDNSNQQQVNSLNNNIKNKQSELDYQNISKLLEIEKLVENKNFEIAAAEIIKLQNIEFKNIEKEKFDKLKQNIALSLLNDGKKLFFEGKYEDSFKKLNTIQKFPDKWDFSPDVLYFIGMCYSKLNDSKQAIEFFRKLQNQYPDSAFNRYRYTEFRIKELLGEP